MQKDVKPHIVLIDGVKYYSDKPETCRSCFFWKNRKVPCILRAGKLLLFSGNHSIRAAEEMRGLLLRIRPLLRECNLL